MAPEIEIKTTVVFTCMMVLSSVRSVHCATTGNAWHTSISDRGGLVFRTTVVRMSMDVCGADREILFHKRRL